MPVTVSVWSTSRLPADIVGVSAGVSCDDTVNVEEADEVAVKESASVTCSSKAYRLFATSALAAMLQVTVLPEIWFEPVGAAHWVALE